MRDADNAAQGQFMIYDRNDKPQSGQQWRHYKSGTIYRVLCVSEHTETMEFLVTYSVGETRYWTRPLTHFMAYIDDNGYIPRFTRVE